MTGNRGSSKSKCFQVRIQNNINSEQLPLEHCLKGYTVQFVGPVRLSGSDTVPCLVRLLDHLVQTKALVLMPHVSAISAVR